MNADEMKRHITTSYAGLRVAEHLGDTFFIFDPDGDLPPNLQMPFATLVTGDNYDAVSALGDGSYRLNLGLPRDRYIALFGPAPGHRDENGVYDTGFDYAARDVLMPHPVYAGQNWVTVVNPDAATLDSALALVAEAYDFAARKHANREARRG
ncbi:DUF6194 family protein [Nocardia sp. NPDC003482]